MLSKKKPQGKVDPEYLVGLDTASAQPAPAGVKPFIKKHWKPIAAVVCAAAVAAAVLVPKNSAKPAAASAQYVETRPEKRNIVNSYSADGTITAADTYTVKPMVKGTVLTADFEVGDTVSKGDVLYTEILRHRKYETTAQAEDYLAKIDTKARQLKQLSDNLFEYALVTRDTVAVLDPPARFSQIFEEPLTEMVGELQERGFACALELGEEDDTLTVKEQYVRRILDNITSNLLKYADPAQDISVRFVKEKGKAGLAFANAVLPGQHRTDSTKVGLTSIETMMEKMHAECRIEQSGKRFCITLLFPITT